MGLQDNFEENLLPKLLQFVGHHFLEPVKRSDQAVRRVVKVVDD